MNKSIISRLMPGLLVAAIGLTFTSCSDDDPKTEDDFTTEYTFEAEFSADLLETADVKAYILSPEGSVTEETVTKARNTWIVKGNSAPDKAGVMFEFDTKSGNFAGNYEIGYAVHTTVTSLDDGNVVSFKSYSSDKSYTVPAEKLSLFYGTSLILAGNVSADGEASVTDGSDIDFGLNISVIRPPFGAGGWH